ncbi:MAG: glutamate formimidoyltransferase [Candidatus Velthaea sp.]
MTFEIVPNLSEGRDAAVVDACAAAMEAAGARVVHRTSDAAHNRSVITAFGSAAQTVAAAVALARETHERIDLRRHGGAHPRMGALDVLPFVPLDDATIEDAVILAHRAAARIWHEVGIPSFLYGAAASAEHRRSLADARRGEFEGLAAKIQDPLWHFDYGDAPHATAGAVAIGARPILIAFNVELATGDLSVARHIARTLRERDGGLATLRALGIRLDAARVQVSFNVTDHVATPLYRITELVRRLASPHGISVARSELIGLLPKAALETTARAYGMFADRPIKEK